MVFVKIHRRDAFLCIRVRTISACETDCFLYQSYVVAEYPSWQEGGKIHNHHRNMHLLTNVQWKEACSFPMPQLFVLYKKEIDIIEQLFYNNRTSLFLEREEGYVLCDTVSV